MEKKLKNNCTLLDNLSRQTATPLTVALSSGDSPDRQNAIKHASAAIGLQNDHDIEDEFGKKQKEFNSIRKDKTHAA